MIPPGIRQGESPALHKMGEYVFQDMCRDLFQMEFGIATCEVYGKRGQKQYGIDLIAHRKSVGEVEVGQCKCFEHFSWKQIRDASDEFFKHWDRWSNTGIKRFILFVACNLDGRKEVDETSSQRKRFAKVGIEYEAWSTAIITNKLRPYHGIVEHYLNASGHWVKTICGESHPPFSQAGEATQKTSVIVETALLSQVEQLASQVSNYVEQEFDQAREHWRQGRRVEAERWVQDLKSNDIKWSILSAEKKAKVLCFEANIELTLRNNFTGAKKLSDEAYAISPSNNQIILKTLISYYENGPESAIKILEDHNDIDSLNLKAALLLDMGRVHECLAILDIDQGS